MVFALAACTEEVAPPGGSPSTGDTASNASLDPLTTVTQAAEATFRRGPTMPKVGSSSRSEARRAASVASQMSMLMPTH